jgi:hypothetical protein
MFLSVPALRCAAGAAFYVYAACWMGCGLFFSWAGPITLHSVWRAVYASVSSAASGHRAFFLTVGGGGLVGLVVFLFTLKQLPVP